MAARASARIGAVAARLVGVRARPLPAVARQRPHEWVTALRGAAQRRTNSTATTVTPSSGGIPPTAAATAKAVPAKPKRRLLKFFGALVGGGAAIAGGVQVYRSQDNGFDRSCHFWGVAAPIYAHYRIVQWQAKYYEWDEAKEDAEYERLHNMYAPTVEKLVTEMKGMYLKNAQLISTRDEFLPPQYMAFCKRMQDQVPAEFGPGEARRRVESSLGRPIDELFEWFDDKPIGAASIGQVHRARLVGGRDVVVKIQYENIEEMFRSDMTTIIRFCKLAQPQHVKPMREIEKQFLTEFDYRGEAQNLQDIRDNVMPVYGDKVYIPAPHMDLCTRDVMVMDFVPGKTLIKGIMDQHRRFAAMMGKTLEELQEEHKAKLARGEIAPKTLEEEAAATAATERKLRMMDYAKNTPKFLYNWTAGWVFENKKYEWTERLINLGTVLDLLNRVHAHEILMDGAFNGDPHPGNVMLLPDGRLGLIDYGQVKRINLETRIQLAKLVLSMARGTRQDVLDAYLATGVTTEKMNMDILYRLACFWFDRDTDDITGGRNVQTFMDWAQEEDPLEDAPEDYIMAARVSVMMRGIANAFNIRMRTAPLWAPVADEFLRQHGVDPDSAIPHRLAEQRDEAERLKALELAEVAEEELEHVVAKIHT